jgi:hypothetical protein
MPEDQAMNEDQAMSEDEAINELQALDAIAAERGMVLAFRVCQDEAGFEPVFMSIHSANPGEENETAMIAFADEDGLPLGRYVIPRDRLDDALAQVQDVEEDDEPAVVPVEWAEG